MQDIALAAYFKFKHAVTKIYHSCGIGMPVVVFVLLLGSPLVRFSKVPRLFGQTSGHIIGSYWVPEQPRLIKTESEYRIGILQ